VTVQPGTTTAQTTLVVPSGTLPGDYGIELQAGASMTSTGLVVVSVDWPTLVSFLVTRF